MADTLKKFFLLRYCLSKNSSLTTVLKFVINFSQLLQVFSLTVILFLLLQLLCYSPCQEVLTYHIRWSTYLLLATLYQDQGLDLCRLEIWQNPLRSWTCSKGFPPTTVSCFVLADSSYIRAFKRTWWWQQQERQKSKYNYSDHVGSNVTDMPMKPCPDGI